MATNRVLFVESRLRGSSEAWRPVTWALTPEYGKSALVDYEQTNQNNEFRLVEYKRFRVPAGV